jgi:hypothetical protein
MHLGDEPQLHETSAPRHLHGTEWAIDTEVVALE